MTREASVEETDTKKEAAYEGETEVDEVFRKVIKRKKFYNISFQIEVFISYEDMR